MRRYIGLMRKHISVMAYIMLHYRFCHYLHSKCYKKKGFRWYFCKLIIFIVYGYYSRVLSFVYGAYLPYQAIIGKNLKLNHSFHGVFISLNARIGDNCTILQHTTIGSNQPISGDSPNIGNNVFIGVNCNIIGKCKIDDDVIIGAGVTIANKDIPNNSIVVGQKFRLIKR